MGYAVAARRDVASAGAAGSRSPTTDPARRTAASHRLALDERQPQPSFRLVAFGRLRVQIPQHLCNFFLDFYDRLGPFELVLGARQRSAKLGVLATEWINDLRLPAALCRGQPAQYTSLAQLAPGIDVRGVQALAAQQSALLASARLLVLSQDAGLVLGTELPTCCSLRYFRVGGHGPGIRFHLIQNFSPHSVI